MVTFRSSDGVVFEVEEKVAELSLTIKHMIDDGCAETVIPLPNVTATTLAKVVEYCKKHVVKERSSDEKAELKKWDQEFVKFDHFPALFDLIMAAHYLNIEDLMDLTCQTTADMIKDMSPEEVRQLLNITNDFTPEEEEEVRRENQWTFE